MVSQQDEKTESRSSWRARGSGHAGGGGETSTRRWQQERAAAQDDPFLAAQRRRRSLLTVLLAISLSLFALLVWTLQFRPTRTSMIAFAVTDYDLPFPPNAWAREDLDGLDDHNDMLCLSVDDISSSWEDVERGWEELGRALERVSDKRNLNRVVIVYLSMHGAVNDEGEACLLPPTTTPLVSEDWRTVESVLRVIGEKTPVELNKLVILDCNRIRANWSLGVVENDFADRLRRAVDDAGVPNLAVLNSTSPGQRGWASRDLGRSVFGHFVRLGLAGMADEEARGAMQWNGNGDGRVTLHELHRYVAVQVSAWTEFNRGETQWPLLVPESAEDHLVTWSLNRRARSRLERESLDLTPAPAEVSDEQMRQLWSLLGELDTENAYRVAPLTWRDIQHRLLRLERLNRAGSAYNRVAGRLHRELADRLKAMVAVASENGRARGVVSSQAVFDPSLDELPSTMSVHSLASAEYFQTIDTASLTDARERFAALSRSVDPQAVAETVDRSFGPIKGGSLTDFYFLHVMSLADVGGSDLLSAALESRARGEALSVPAGTPRRVGDERAHPWYRDATDLGDVARRRAEDLMLARDDALRPEIFAAWNEAGQRYDDAERRRASVEAAFRIRDRAWAETPFLAEWLCRDARGEFRRAEVAREVTEEDDPQDNSLENHRRRTRSRIDDLLLPLIRNTHSLADLLNRPRPELVFDDLVQSVERDLSELSELFRQDWQDHYGGDETVRELRSLDAALAIPLIPPRERGELTHKRSVIASRLAADYFKRLEAADEHGPEDRDQGEPPIEEDWESESGAEQPAGDAENSRFPESHRQWMARWARHPLLEILPPDALRGPDGEATEADTGPSRSDNRASRPASWLIRLESTARTRLSAVARRMQELSEPAATGTGDNARATRLRETEHLVRAAAPLWFPAPKTSPIETLRRYDLRELLLWQCRRVLCDCWGPLPDTRGTGESGPPAPLFFELAARDYLSSARAILDSDRDGEQRINELGEIGERQAEAIRHGLDLTTESTPANEEDEAFNVRFGVAGQSTQWGLAQGQGAVYVSDGARRLSASVDAEGDSTRPLVQLPPAQRDPQQFRIAVPRSRGETPELAVSVLFRGNVIAEPFSMQSVGGVAVQYSPTRFGPPKVTLNGNRRQRASIVFVLDCSHSMGEPIRVEASGQATSPRLDLAKVALRDMLHELAQRGDTRVGVRFFAHRMGWRKPAEETDPPPPPKLLVNDQYLNNPDDPRPPIAIDRGPNEDVELVLPLGQFDSIDAGRVNRLMQYVKPFGQSPLYLSLIEALGDFARDDSDTEKTIIVITDGVNYYYDPPGADSRDVTPPTIASVQEAWNKQNVAIHVLGFGVPESEFARAESQFRQIKDITGGSYNLINSGSDLLRLLRERLQLDGYYLTDSQDRVVSGVGRGDEPLIDLNQTAVISPPPDEPSDYNLVFQSLTRGLRLEGGEALELIVTPDGRDIQALPYDVNFPQTVPLVTGVPPTPNDHVLRVHRLLKDGDDVTVPISIQNPRELVTARPAEAWIEVTPVGRNDDNAAFSYTFYDVNYLDGMPVPVLKWTAEDWPLNSDRARIRFWCKPRKTGPDEIIKFGDVQARVADFREGVPLQEVDGVRLRIRQRQGVVDPTVYQVLVDEIHDPDSVTPINVIKVEFQTEAGVRPRRVYHQFDEKTRRVRHIFEYDVEDRGRIRDSDLSVVLITRKESLLDGAWQLPPGQTILSDVFANGDVLSIESAAGPSTERRGAPRR